jgi:hypothetical protein
MPSFNGTNIFGVAVSITTVDNPRGNQLNSFPGINGLESLDQGLRGRFTDATGKLTGANAADLADAEALFRSYNDGGGYVLVDSYGNSWGPVKLESFEPQGRIRRDVAGGFFRDYKARFLHL